MREPIISQSKYGYVIQIDREWLQYHNFTSTVSLDGLQYNIVRLQHNNPGKVNTNKIEVEEIDWNKFLQRMKDKN